MRTRRKYRRRRFRSSYMVLAKCQACGHEEEIATFQRADQARAWVKKVQVHSKRRISIVREV